MDPNACLKRINGALTDNDEEEAREARADLYEWLAKGGFAPDWNLYPAATEFFRAAYRTSPT